MIFNSTPKQRQLIGYFRKLLKLNEDVYYDILSGYGVNSSKELNNLQAEDLLKRLKYQAASMGLYTEKTNYYNKYDNMAGRFGMGTPKQLRMIEAMWKSVSNQDTNELKERALNHFVLRLVGKSHIKFLTQSEISKVIKAIQAMQKQRETVIM